ncbi:MAG: hypothetical protein HY305_06055, partial [Sphingobacteriales bacterium]|nr:hypothetical protein [Sphingobacteriales bacterium]
VNAIEKQQFDKFAAGGTINLTNFLYASKDYPAGVAINTLATNFTPSKINITTLDGRYLSTNFTGNGQINNLANYILQNKPLNANLNVNADNINLNELMGTPADTTTATVATPPFIVPNNLDVTLNTNIGKVHYDKLDIDKLSGTVKVSDETASLNNVKGNALDGQIGMSGSYSTKVSKTKPAITFNYDVTKVDIQKTFNAFNTVQKIMPISKFISGKMTSQLFLTGTVGNGMSPDLNTLTGKGNLLMIDGLLSKFAPLDKIVSTLNLKGLSPLSLKDVKAYYQFANGKLAVDPFPVKVSSIEMQVGGVQGFDQSMDYLIAMKVPRALLGNDANNLVNNLVNQVNSNGVALKVADIINVNVKLGGTISNPTVKTDFKQSSTDLTKQLKDQATSFVQGKIDSTKKAVTKAVNDTIAAVKKQAVNVAKDEISKQVFGSKGDSTKPVQKVEQQARGLIKGLFGK